MLAPTAYQRDCLNIVGTIVNHGIHSEDTYQQSLVNSEKYWTLKYPNEPFLVDLDKEEYGDRVNGGNYNFSYNIQAAAGRQRVFCYQVSLPHYTDKKFLDKALTRYKKYLFLKHKNPQTFLVPCYDMDLMWHSHMNFPLSYKAVTETLLGTTLNHDDSVNDRSEGSRLNNADANTRHLWKNTFNEHFASFGAMYRGDPPTGKLNGMTEDSMYKLVSKYIEVYFNKVEIQGERKTSLGKFKIQFTEKNEMLLPGRYMGEKEVVDLSEKLLTLKGPELEWENAGKINKYVHCQDSDNLNIMLTQQKSFMCCTSGNELEGEGHVDLNSLTTTLNTLGQQVSKKIVIDIDSDLKVALDMTLTLKKLGTCDLWLVPGEYESCVMPEDSEQLWGPVTLPRLPAGVENNCSVASHKYVKYKSITLFQRLCLCS